VPAVAEVGKAVLSFEAIFQASLQLRVFFKRTVVTLLDLRRSGMVENRPWWMLSIQNYFLTPLMFELAMKF
jgi:hypothetical protein